MSASWVTPELEVEDDGPANEKNKKPVFLASNLENLKMQNNLQEFDAIFFKKSYFR